MFVFFGGPLILWWGELFLKSALMAMSQNEILKDPFSLSPTEFKSLKSITKFLVPFKQAQQL